MRAGAIHEVAPAFFCGNKRDTVPIIMPAHAISSATRRLIRSGRCPRPARDRGREKTTCQNKGFCN